MLHFTVLYRYYVFLQIEGLWQPCVEQVYLCDFSNSICSLCVSELTLLRLTLLTPMPRAYYVSTRDQY